MSIPMIIPVDDDRCLCFTKDGDVWVFYYGSRLSASEWLVSKAG